MKETESRESGAIRDETYQRLAYNVPAGSVTVFITQHWARIATLTEDFHGADLVRADDVLIETRIERRDFRVRHETGELTEYGASYAADGSVAARWGRTLASDPEYAHLTAALTATG